MLRDGWFCQYLEEDLKASLSLKLILDDPQKIKEMVQKGGASMILEDKQAIDHGTEVGRGSVWLNLTPEQYEKLKRPARGIRRSARNRDDN